MDQNNQIEYMKKKQQEYKSANEIKQEENLIDKNYFSRVLSD